MLAGMQKYKILNPIHKGQTSIIYTGLQIETNKQVVIKIGQKKNIEDQNKFCNMKTQIQILKKINHPNIVSIKDIIQTAQQIIMVTDFEGQNLQKILEQSKSLPYHKLKEISLQILDAMIYLNQNRIVHRKLTPQSILIKDNHIKICGFGYAEEQGPQNTITNLFAGSTHYMAPQMIKGQCKICDFKVDIWAFGCIMYKIFTGKTPFVAPKKSSIMVILAKIISEQVEYPQSMPSDLKNLLISMFQKDPKARATWNQIKDYPFFKLNN